MRLLTGPAGSGKTAILLNEFRAALRDGHSGIRLLTPTATLALHLQNEVAREGLVFQRNLVLQFHRAADSAPSSGDLDLGHVFAVAQRLISPS